MLDTVDPAEAGLETTVAYVPGVRGHAVVAVGENEDGQEALAAWRIDAAGQAIGAWAVPLSSPDSDHLATVAAAALSGCALVGWTADEPAAVLGAAGLAVPPVVVAIPDLLAEIVEHRRHYEEVNETFRVTAKSKITPLAWSFAVPPDDPARAVRSRHRPPAASPVVAGALHLAADLRRAIELWQDTESVRSRRAHLRRLGDVQPLPPRWLAALRAAGKAAA